MMSVFINITVLFIFVSIFVSCAAEEKGIAKLESKKDNDGEFYYIPLNTDERLLKALKGVDYLKTGKTKDKFPFIGIRGYFLVNQGDEQLILVMIEPVPNEQRGGLFHLSKSKKIGDRIYSVDEPPDYNYLRIFRDEKLWASLDKAMKEAESEKEDDK